MLALAWPDAENRDLRRPVDGNLVFPPPGTKGFGYDAIFPPERREFTFGEMTDEENMASPPTARWRCRIGWERSRD